MKASATKSNASKNCALASAAGKVSEAALVLMQIFGLHRIGCRKLRSAEFERIVADVSLFDEAPESVRAAGLLVKDALAEILASVGIVSIDISLEEGDSAMLEKGYAAMTSSKPAAPANPTENSEDNACNIRQQKKQKVRKARNPRNPQKAQEPKRALPEKTA